MAKILNLELYINLIITQMIETFPELFSTGEVITDLTFYQLLSILFKHVFSLFPKEDILQHHQPGLQPCITPHSCWQCSLHIPYSFNWCNRCNGFQGEHFCKLYPNFERVQSIYEKGHPYYKNYILSTSKLHPNYEKGCHNFLKMFNFFSGGANFGKTQSPESKFLA